MMTITTDVLDLQEASAYLRLRRHTLRRLAAKGTVPALRIGKQWRFRRCALEELFGELALADPRKANRMEMLPRPPSLPIVGERAV